MNKPNDDRGDQPNQRQRERLENAEEQAAAQQPGSYKKEETADKVVEIGPDKDDDPIKGIDPD